MAAVDHGSGPGFAVMQFPDLLVYGCYYRLGGPLVLSETFLAGLERDVRSRYRQDMALIVAVNAKSPSWGLASGDTRGAALENFMASVAFGSENVGSVPTFVMGDRASVMDVTVARLPRGSSIRDWRMRDDIFIDSDHHYVIYVLSSASLHYA